MLRVSIASSACFMIQGLWRGPSSCPRDKGSNSPFFLFFFFAGFCSTKCHFPRAGGWRQCQQLQPGEKQSLTARVPLQVPRVPSQPPAGSESRRFASKHSKKALKASLTLGILLGMFFVAWLPFFITNMTQVSTHFVGFFFNQEGLFFKSISQPGSRLSCLHVSPESCSFLGEKNPSKARENVGGPGKCSGFGKCH